MPAQRISPSETTITFLLPFGGISPIGGFKVVYEYANRLAERGWCVRVAHPRFLSQEEGKVVKISFISHARQWLGYQCRRITGDYRDYRPDSWFEIDPKVKMLYPKTPNPRHMPLSDIWVATAWYTAKWAATYSGARIYLIQHLETWGASETDVMATWRLPLRKVVIARWLENVARDLGEHAQYIPNGLDFRTFGMDMPPEQRDPYAVAMLYHEADWKGSSDGLRALHEVKEKVPGLKTIIFGTSPAPSGLPAWVEYHHNPSQRTLREIYNRAAIFVSPSWTEGFGLTPAEALQCGAALAVTDNGGHREYSHQGETALLSLPKDPAALAANVIHLLEDQKLRLRLAHQGHRHIQKFTWDRAVASFESVLQGALAECPCEEFQIV